MFTKRDHVLDIKQDSKNKKGLRKHRECSLTKTELEIDYTVRDLEKLQICGN